MNNKGLTFIETIVYLTIVSTVLVAIIGFSHRVITAGEKSSTIEEVQQNARFALERIGQEVRKSAKIADDSTLGASLVSGGFLHLDQGVVDDDSDDIYFQITNNGLTIKTGPSGTEEAITSGYIQIDNLTFTAVNDIGDYQSVKVDFAVSFASDSDLPEYDWDITLEDTLTIRAKQ